ncbi:exodeoxyribonuclease VII large subunit [Candidatus Marinarcus aquaticus]|uniref:Exodeoxyribonuclease 7 large subunit n=1 Tax=Candidatus Marinarcus aquaticus TaxID=2044504 RepID=A0A4Q0XS63_9BACT|nr:exodeoxyribonuclease VII large subunit [Candidatus Marinarcus aquaticus]RXJ57526.1 exodeoxyribonuclease VII large subunit [Candidatus Marinarcus aquaticus]
MNGPITVSELNGQIKSLLETTFSYVYVEGEISNLTYHNSGHIYFSIKDDKSTISCVMFKGNAQYLKFRLEVGQKINISGSITVYAPRGNYQLLCQKIEPSGIGELALAYEQLKKRLQAQGYFNPEIKKSLPKYPKTIAIVTSSTGAAIQDMKKVALHRWPLTKFILIPALVQGQGAKEDIVKAIKKADSLKADILIVGRGGGSIEDLWAFNEECVAQAIYEASTPVISAVGHEVDFVISDFVADVRAATPSNAIEIALPDMNEMLQYLDELHNDYNRSFTYVLNNKIQALNHLIQSFKQNSFANKFKFIEENIKSVKEKFNQAFSQQLQNRFNDVEFLKNSFELNHPDKRIKKGYVQVTKENKIIALEDVKIDDVIDLQSTHKIVRSKVLDINSIK